MECIAELPREPRDPPCPMAHRNLKDIPVQTISCISDSLFEGDSPFSPEVRLNSRKALFGFLPAGSGGGPGQLLGNPGLTGKSLSIPVISCDFFEIHASRGFPWVCEGFS